jgi:NADH:ubiquinone oxidoreductase subunit F (NADH-binding)
MSAAEIDRRAVAPRLFAGLGHGPVGLDTHLAQHGAPPRLGRELIALAEASGLTGRGGGGFPTARKLAAVAGRRARRVVVNAVEGEPASGKDRALVRNVPHLVLDGAVLAAEAIGAREAVVACGGASELELAALRREIDARAHRRLDRRVRLEAVSAPGAFVAGEETALVAFLDGGPAKPTFGPRPFERGVLVQNAETIAQLALLGRYGPQWETTLVTLTGAIATRGVYEVALGTSVEELLALAGDATEPLRALLLGGYFGEWLDAPRAAEVRIGPGARLGARAIVALPEGACGVVETARIARYLAEESAGQCGPCVHGLRAISDSLVRLARRERHDRARLARWVEQVRGRGACKHPDGAARLVASGLTVFADEVDLHLRGHCSGANRAVCPVPRR